MGNIYAVYDPATGEITTAYVVTASMIERQMIMHPGKRYLLVGPEDTTGPVTLKNIHDHKVEKGEIVPK